MAFAPESHSKTYSHINGSAADLLDRLAVSELCKGWPVYRDASEWMNFRDLFAEDAYVWTTWSGPRTVADFIRISMEGKTAGAFIQHRECGTLVELNSAAGRALGKMKATITQRFTDPGTGVEYDIDCDCRFLFFCRRAKSGPESKSAAAWEVSFVKLIYEKDKVVPVDGRTVPEFGPDELRGHPDGYRYLAAAQARLGYAIDNSLATVKDKAAWDRMYGCMERWLDGEQDPGLFWEKDE